MAVRLVSLRLIKKLIKNYVHHCDLVHEWSS